MITVAAMFTDPVHGRHGGRGGRAELFRLFMATRRPDVASKRAWHGRALRSLDHRL
jgi:hypothetical protein